MKEAKYIQMSLFKDSDIYYDKSGKQIGKTDRKTTVRSPVVSLCQYKEYLSAADGVWSCAMARIGNDEPGQPRIQPNTLKCGEDCPYYKPCVLGEITTAVSITTKGGFNNNGTPKRNRHIKHNKR